MLCFVRSIATKYISLSNEPCLAIDLNSDENNKRLWHCPFMVRLDRCLNPSSRIYVLKRTEDANLNVFIMIKGIMYQKH